MRHSPRSRPEASGDGRNPRVTLPRPTLRRHALGLLAGYLGIFLALHTQLPKGAPGLLGLDGPSQTVTRGLDPVRALAASLGLPAGPAAQALFLTLALTLVLLYWRALLAVRRDDPAVSLWGLLAWTTLFSLPLVLAPTIPSLDAHLYSLFARVDIVYHENPLRHAPLPYRQDPFWSLGYSHWLSWPAPYGPLWLIVSRWVAVLADRAGGAVWTYLLAFKLLALGFHLLAGSLLWHLLAHAEHRQRVWGTLFYLWNPIAVIEFAASAHNDSVVVATMLAGLWCAHRRRWRLGVLILAAGTMVKFVPVILLAGYGLLLISESDTWRRRAARVLQIAAIVTATLVACYAPYWDARAGVAGLFSYEASDVSVNSISHVIQKAMALWSRRAGGDYGLAYAHLGRLAGWISRSVIVAALGVFGLAVWRRPTLETVVRGSFWVLLTALLVRPEFWPWYTTWCLGLAALMPWGAEGRTILALGAGALALNTNLPGMQLLVFGPVLVVLALEARRWPRTQSDPTIVLRGTGRGGAGDAA